MKAKVKIITDLVRRYLIKNPRLRDDDTRLICSIWWTELKQIGIDPENSLPMMEALIAGQLSHPESIMRSRRKLQEEEKHLRGSNYKERHKNSERVINKLRYKTTSNKIYKRPIIE